MMTRLLPLAALLLAAPALAQPAPPMQPGGKAGSQVTAQPQRPRLSRNVQQMPRLEAPPLLGTAQAATPTRHAELAPMPNRDIEAPIAGYSMQARLMPDVIRGRMPGRTANTDGVLNQREERAYAPAAGARLTLPFFTR